MYIYTYIYICIYIYIYYIYIYKVSNMNDVNPGGHPGPHHTLRTNPSRKNIQG